MNSLFATKYLQHLNKKKADNNEKGFTLIELLVVVIIIGVLAAVALPNLLGQVGKARESEAKSAMGALNRAQQAYHLETREFYAEPTVGDFSNTVTALGVVPGGEFYDYGNYSTATGDDNASNSEIVAIGINPDNDGVRDFAAAMHYAGGEFSSQLCVAVNKQTGTALDAQTAGDVITRADADPAGTDCTSGNSIQ